MPGATQQFEERPARLGLQYLGDVSDIVPDPGEGCAGGSRQVMWWVIAAVSGPTTPTACGSRSSTALPVRIRGYRCWTDSRTAESLSPVVL
jgi:hypothetical protein